MAKITYADKVALNENPSIADINKVNAADMNEIKTVVNGLVVNTNSNSQESSYSSDYINNINTYSTDETLTGKYWINGKPIYRKVIVLSTYVDIPRSWTTVTNISSLNIEALLDIKLYDNSVRYWNSCLSRINSNNLQLLNVGVDGTSWAVKTLILEYTKTTD